MSESESESESSEESEESYHWGEIRPMEEVPEEFAELMIKNAMKPVPVKLHETCGKQETSMEELPRECSAMDPTVIHTIKLLQYAKSIQPIIEKLKTTRTNSADSGNIAPPVFPEPLNKKIHLVHPSQYMQRVSTPFMEGSGPPPHRLTETNARSILRKCVATIFAHIGYDDSTQVALDIMTDISENYFTKFTRLLRMAADQEMLAGNVGFPDVMERTFHDMGIGSILVMHDFYQERILMYHQRMLEHCQKLTSEYDNLLTSGVKKEVGEIIECKMETEEDYSNVPELHVPASGDGTSPDQLCPPFVQGFKMLQRIEQEEQLQNIIKEEEIMITDASGGR